MGDLDARVLRFDPTWKPTPSVDTSIEGRIEAFENGTRESKEYLDKLRELAIPRDPNTGDPISSPYAKTGNALIDSTTEKLMDILAEVMDRIGPRPDLDAKGYGTLVHTEFAKAVRAADLPGIARDDVERTFGIQEDASHGAKYSIRPDTILRYDDGKIAAIYDVKTGGGLTRFRIIQLRFMTDSGSDIPVFELHRSRGPMWKRNLMGRF